MSNEELVTVIQGGEDRMGELWQQVERLVSWKANRIMTALNGRGGVEFDDLYQSGYPAMVAAVDSYKPEVGAFSTWFMLHLKTAFAEATGYRSNRQQRDPIHNAVSLDTPLTDDADSGDLMDVVADPAGAGRMEAVEEVIYRQQLHDALEEALEAIPEECGTVLRQRYYEGRTLSDLAEVQGVSMEMVRKRERDALRRLRSPKTACRLRPFYDFDFYCGTGLGAFRHTGMSIQERYLVIEEERRERAEKERQRRYEEATAAADEALARSMQLTEELMKELSPDARERFARSIFSRHK